MSKATLAILLTLFVSTTAAVRATKVPPDSLSAQQLATFMCYVSSNLAREAGRLYQWKEKFWGRRYQGIVVSNEAESQIDRLEYILSHGVKEGLVERPQDWPGAHSVNAPD